MANDTGAFGLRPVKHITGAPWNGQTIRCYVSSGYATALYIGDPVILETESDNLDTTATNPTVIVATGADGEEIFGVIVSFQPDPDNLEKQYGAASTTRYANVCVDPSVIYQVRDDGLAALTAITSVGLNATLTMGSGSTATGLSGAVLDTTTPAANASMPLWILRLADLPNNEIGASAIWEVVIGNHMLSSSGGGTDGRILGTASST